MELTNEELKKIIESAEVIETDSLNAVFQQAEERQDSLWDLIVAEGFLSDEQIGQLVAANYDVPFVNLNTVSIDDATLNLISRTVADEHTVIAFAQDENSIKVATTDPFDVNFFNVLQKLSGKDIIPYLTTFTQINKTLKRYKKGLQQDVNDLIESVSNAELNDEEAAGSLITTIVNMIITYGFENEASDIHFEPEKQVYIVRFRIDGILHDMVSLPIEFVDKIVSRIKVLSRLRTDEHSSAQDGRLKFALNEKELDVRVSIIPTSFGEKIVLRLLASETKSLSLEELGLSGKELEIVKNASKASFGMILSTGPTGSGKTTSLYAILKILNSREVNITTIEDPIEYRIEGVNQIQVNAKTNLTFAHGLRSILRQDPDIVMVGEIRDEETAGIAVNAAMTGHLVLSSLHTNDAATALPRLLDMGIESYLVASTVNVIIGQRLVRKICTSCIKSFKLTKEDIDKYGDVLKTYLKKTELQKARFYVGNGCPVCNNTGFKGRVGIFEVLDIDDDLRKLIKEKADSSVLLKQAVKSGMKTMIQDGVEKAVRGVTTLDEVIRVSIST